MKSVWDLLEIPRGSDRDTIRRAYAKKLRATHPEDDPEGFKRLREAYEAALEQHDSAVRWADYDEDSEEEIDSGPAEPPPLDWGVHARPAGSHGSAPDPTADTTPDAIDSTTMPELDAMLAEREEELAALRSAMADLEAGLRGPWRPGDAVLEERLKAILASPAMGEIRIRDDVEPWLADVIASTIPYSDAVLMQSVQAFGWGSDDHHLRGTSWSISTVLGRLDEWRIIEGLNHYSHSYHAAWRSLTRPPGAWWSWRLDAFRPGLIDGVETLLGEHGEVSPGLHFSFKADSVERWRTFLAKPRLTLGVLAMLPIAFLAALWLGYIVAGTGMVGNAWMIGGMVAVGFVTPAAILFTLAPWRKRWRAVEDHPRWQREGWLAAYGLLGFAAAALPRPWWPALVLLPAMIVAGWTYVAAQRTEPGPLRIGGGAATLAVAGFFSLMVLHRLAPAENLALGTMVALLAYLRIAAWPAVRIVLEDLLWRHREWIILGGVLLGLGAAAGIGWLRTSWQPVLPFYTVALAAIVLVPLVGAPDRGIGGPPRWIARALLMLAFLWALGASLPPAKRTATSPEQSVPSGPVGPSQPLERSERSRLDSRETASLESIDATMAMLEREQPGFRQVRRGNRPLYAKVREVMTRYYRYEITRDKADELVAALIDDAYDRMAPDADSGLLVEGLRVRLEREQTLRRTDPAACAAGTTPADGAALPEALRKSQNAQFFAVLSTPPASPRERAAGTAIKGPAIATRVMTALHIDLKTLNDRITGKEGPAAKCEVRIAFTQATLDNRLDDIAATLRRDLRRLRDENPVSAPETTKAGDRQGQSPA